MVQEAERRRAAEQPRHLADAGQLQDCLARAASMVTLRPASGVFRIWKTALTLDAPGATEVLRPIWPRPLPPGRPPEQAACLQEVLGERLAEPGLLTALAERVPDVALTVEEFLNGQAQTRERERRQRLQTAQQHLQACGVPQEVAHPIAWDCLQPCKAVLRAERWLAEWRAEVRSRAEGQPFRVTPRWLMFGGPMDASKSTAAAWLLWQWERARTSGRLEHGGRFLSWEWGLSVWVHEPTEAEPAEPVTGLRRVDLLRVGLLVLDDVGQEPRATTRQAEVTADAQERIIFARIHRGLPVVTTSNFSSIDEMAAFYGRERLVERFVESGLWITCAPGEFRTWPKKT